MSDIFIIKLTTNDGGEYTGKMSRRQPELVRHFVSLVSASIEGILTY